MAVCQVCGKYDALGLDAAMRKGGKFTKCPECLMGTPLDIAKMYLAATMGENYIEGFCSRHWFKDSGICGYCRMKREGIKANVA